MSKTKKVMNRMIDAMQKGAELTWVRKTRFIPQRDGSIRRLVTRKDGTIEKDEVIPADRVLVAKARAKTGLSQEKFALLLGISPRTLRDWEHARRAPTGAAVTLLRIAAKHPEVLREVA